MPQSESHERNIRFFVDYYDKSDGSLLNTAFLPGLGLTKVANKCLNIFRVGSSNRQVFEKELFAYGRRLDELAATRKIISTESFYNLSLYNDEIVPKQKKHFTKPHKTLAALALSNAIKSLFILISGQHVDENTYRINLDAATTTLKNALDAASYAALAGSLLREAEIAFLSKYPNEHKDYEKLTELHGTLVKGGRKGAQAHERQHQPIREEAISAYTNGFEFRGKKYGAEQLKKMSKKESAALVSEYVLGLPCNIHPESKKKIKSIDPELRYNQALYNAIHKG